MNAPVPRPAADLPFWRRPIRLGGSAAAARVSKLSTQALAGMMRQMATLAAVMPISDAVATLARQPAKEPEKSILSATNRALQSGTTLAAALPASIPPEVRATIAAGEASGRLPILMARLADTLEAQAALRSRLIAALAYPALLVIVAVVVIIAMLIFVVPSIAEQLVGSGQPLPLLTRIVLGVSDFFRAWWWAIVALMLAGGLALAAALRHPGWRMWLDRRVLRLPLIGSSIAMMEAVRLSRLLATMLAAGLPLAEALAITAPTLRNSQWRDAVVAMAGRVRGGSSLTATLTLLPDPPGLLVALVQSGESSGRLVPLLESAAASLDRMVSDRSRTAMSLAEPLIIVVLGSIVALIILSVLLPILQLNTLAGAAIGAP